MTDTTADNLNPLALVHGQRAALANGSPNITLTRRQTEYLRAHGCEADIDETWVHPNGAFALPPKYGNGKGRRTRLNLK